MFPKLSRLRFARHFIRKEGKEDKPFTVNMPYLPLFTPYLQLFTPYLPPFTPYLPLFTPYLPLFAP